ncbi:helix-turn-helix transcriptional regulator [bacterium]|nr:helix-turn-helix transcriptional regulator [bacterium]
MNSDLIYKNIGNRVKYLREANNLTQEKLAELTGLSTDYIGKIEVNINKPGLRALIKIAEALNVHIKELFNF